MSVDEILGTTEATTKLGVWLISVHDVDIESSSFGASFRLVYEFSCANLDSKTPYKAAGDRTYYHLDDFQEALPGQFIEIPNMLSGGNVPTLFYAGHTRKGLLFHRENQEQDVLTYEEKYFGVFKQTFDLRRFPYEAGSLTINLVFWRGTQSDHTRTWQMIDLEAETPGGDRVDLPDFVVDGTELTLVGKPGAGQSPSVDFAINLHRRPWFYAISSSLSMIIVILFSLTTFGISSQANGTAIGIVGSLLLATIAVRFVISQDTPRVPYTTSTDREAISTFVFLLVIAFLHTDFNPLRDTDINLTIALAGAALAIVAVLAPLAKYMIRHRD